MALPRKRRKRRLTLPEYVGVLLLAFSLGSGALWWVENSKASWPSARARLVELAQVRGASTAAPQVAFTYQYSVAGALYNGVSEDSQVVRPILNLIPRELITLLETHSVLRLDELLNDAALVGAAAEGMDTDVIPEHVKAELRARGYGSGAELSAKMESGEFARDLSEARSAMATPASLPQPADATPTKAKATLASGRDGYAVTVRYKPNAPWRSVVDYPGFELRIPYMVLSGALIACTLMYFGLVYPHWKRSGY